MMTSNHSEADYTGASGSELAEKIRELEASGAQVEMPRYQCHKKVWALKIELLVDPTPPGAETDGSRIIVPTDRRYAPFRVDRQYVDRHKPEVGGYYVVYDDGYKSYSPAKAFEDGYTPIAPDGQK